MSVVAYCHCHQIMIICLRQKWPLKIHWIIFKNALWHSWFSIFHEKYELMMWLSSPAIFHFYLTLYSVLSYYIKILFVSVYIAMCFFYILKSFYVLCKALWIILLLKDALQINLLSLEHGIEIGTSTVCNRALLWKLSVFFHKSINVLGWKVAESWFSAAAKQSTNNQSQPCSETYLISYSAWHVRKEKVTNKISCWVGSISQTFKQ